MIDHNQTLLNNLYAELTMCQVKHDEHERAYFESIAQMNALNLKIIETKKLRDRDDA